MTRGVTGAAQRTVTRRGLFKGAGFAALATAAASTLSGCGEGQQVEAPAKSLTTQRPAAPAWLGEPPAVDEADIAETINVDVVVVGCGTGGIPAIISAAENGARVLGIDQQETVSNVREDIGAIDSALQRETEKTFPEFHIDKMEALGIYEVAPEDFALAEFVDSSKLELQSIIRRGLDMLRKENG